MLPHPDTTGVLASMNRRQVLTEAATRSRRTVVQPPARASDATAEAWHRVRVALGGLGRRRLGAVSATEADGARAAITARC